MDVVLKNTQYDMFSPQSGQRVGRFHPEGVIPWRPEEEISSGGYYHSSSSSSSSSNKSRTSNKRKVPPGIVLSKAHGSSLEYRESLRYELEAMQQHHHPQQQQQQQQQSMMTMTMKSTAFEVMWCCPEPELGDAVVSLNCQLRSTGRWVKLSYLLKESAIR